MSAVDRVLGAPFSWTGASPAEGFNCYSLCRWLGREWGVPVPDRDELVRMASRAYLLDARELFELPGWTQVGVRETQHGDWVWMRAAERPDAIVNHVELVERPGLSVTARLGEGVRRVIWDAAWRRRLHAIWRAPCSA